MKYILPIILISILISNYVKPKQITKLSVEYRGYEQPTDPADVKGMETGGEQTRGDIPAYQNIENAPDFKYPRTLQFTHFKITLADEKTKNIQTAKKYAKEYGISSETLLCTLNMESGVEGFERDFRGELTTKTKCGDGGISCGVGQIKKATWTGIRKVCGLPTEDIRDNEEENIKTTACGMANGYEYHWTGYRNCEKLGYKLK